MPNRLLKTGRSPGGRSLALFFACCLALACRAQTPPPAPTTPPAVLPQVEQLGAPPARPASDGTRLPTRPGAAPREVARPADDLKIDVTAYVVEGGPPALQQALPAITAPYVGPGRRYEDLLEAANAVTVYLQTKLGLYLGHAYLPEQVPADGRVRIVALEGRLDRVVLNWSDELPVSRAVVQAYLDRLQPGSVLKVDEVERVVFLVNDLRGVGATFEFKEGREWGTAELVVTPRPEPRWSHRVEFDTDGSRYSGVERLGWQSAINSPAGLGDAVTLGALVSAGGGLGFGLVGYTAPVGSSGLKLGASLSAFRYRFDKDLLPQDVNGTAAAASVYALYPWVRTRNLNLFSLVSLEHKRFADRQGAPDEVEVRKHSTELRLAATGDWRDDVATGGVSTYDLSATVGRITFDRNAPLFSDDSRDVRKIGYAFTRLQNLVDGRLLAYVNLRGQQAYVNLDSTQQFRLGGADGVRAFASGERPGDSGQLLSLELRMLPPATWFGGLGRELVFSVHYDVGRVRLRDDASLRPADFENRATLAGAGIGIAWERPGFGNFRLYASEPQRGQPTGDPVERHPRVYAQIAKQL